MPFFTLRAASKGHKGPKGPKGPKGRLQTSIVVLYVPLVLYVLYVLQNQREASGFNSVEFPSTKTSLYQSRG